MMAQYNILKNMFGEETGFSYLEGGPVKVGDRISLRDISAPATIRVRFNNKSHNLYYYATYTVGNRTYTVPMSRIAAESGFRPYSGNARKGQVAAELEEHPEEHPEKRDTPERGWYIVGLEDYDHAIYK